VAFEVERPLQSIYPAPGQLRDGYVPEKLLHDRLIPFITHNSRSAPGERKFRRDYRSNSRENVTMMV
jgi:hypothetical protein